MRTSWIPDLMVISRFTGVPSKKKTPARFFDSWPFWVFDSWPLQGWKRDLHLGDQKVTWKKLETWFFSRSTLNYTTIDIPCLLCLLHSLSYTIWTKLGIVQVRAVHFLVGGLPATFPVYTCFNRFANRYITVIISNIFQTSQKICYPKQCHYKG